MLWYKGWLETRIKLAMSLGFMCILLIFVHSHLARAHWDGAGNSGLVANCLAEPNLPAGGFHMVGGGGNRHASRFSGNKRSSWLNPVHSFPARQPVPVAGSPGRHRLAGDGWGACHVLLRNVADVSAASGNRYAG